MGESPCDDMPAMPPSASVQATAEELGGYVVHTVVTVNYADYPEKLWSVVQSAAGGMSGPSRS